MADVIEPGLWKYWRQELLSLKSECHDITSKYPETASVAQQVCTVISDVEILAKCTPTGVGESSQWTIVKSGEENSENFAKF
jgi:hypothetical protein